MNIKTGDFVHVLNESVKGKVTWCDGSFAKIIDEEGFEFRYAVNQLVKIPEKQSDIEQNLFNNHLLRDKKNLDNTPKKSKYSKKKQSKIPPMEIDLHIEKIVRSHKAMSNCEILEKQIDFAKDKINFAISKKIPRVIFIHGVGKGVLKKELHKLLRGYSLNYKPACFQKYAKGATEVILN